MRAKYLGKTEFLVLTNGKVYEVLSVERDCYRIVDDSGEDYLYPPELFELVKVWPPLVEKIKKPRLFSKLGQGMSMVFNYADAKRKCESRKASLCKRSR